MGPVARRVDIELGADYQQAHDRGAWRRSIVSATSTWSKS